LMKRCAMKGAGFRRAAPAKLVRSTREPQNEWASAAILGAIEPGSDQGA
jgi:hypothetical protein